jgi:YHS domain-containing protein
MFDDEEEPTPNENNWEGDISDDDDLVEDEDASIEAEGVQQGFDEDERLVTCAYCKKIILEKDEAIEKTIDGKQYLFCSQSCCDNFKAEKDDDIY